MAAFAYAPPDLDFPDGEIGYVCKVVTGAAVSGPYSFTALTSVGSTDPGWDGAISNGECDVVQLWGSSGSVVSVAEVSIPTGVQLDSIWVIQRDGLTVDTLRSYAPTTSVSGAMGGAPRRGFVMVFFNGPVPPPPPPPSLPGRMTGGGSVFMGDVRFTHGFELHCDPNDLPNNLEVNWPDNRFHLTSLTSVVCIDDPALHPLPRKAGFDTYIATGVGLWNGQPGATIDFVFTDDGEPGKNDHATMTITPPGGSPVTVDGYLYKGNHQAHWVK